MSAGTEAGGHDGLPEVESRLARLLADPSTRLSKEVGRICTPSRRGWAGQGGDVVPSEEADTWAFCWMPALEDFLGGRANGGGGGQRKDSDPRSYNEVLLADRTFHNPHALEEMAAAFRLGDPRLQARSFFMAPPEVEEGRFYSDEIRDLQNRGYADEKVKVGVELNREGKYQDAIKLYEQALSTYPRHVDALVARGAAQANLGHLRRAMLDFEEALRIDPDVQNARNYLKTIRAKIDSETRGSSSSRPSPFAPTPPGSQPLPPPQVGGDHAGSSSLHQYVSGSMPPEVTAGGGLREYSSTIGKLEELIRAENEGKRRKHHKKHKKKRSRDDDSHDDDDDGERKHKKKKKKKRKKKDKKKRRRKEDSGGESGSSSGDEGRSGASSHDEGSGSEADKPPPGSGGPQPHPILERKRPAWGT